MKKSFLTAAVGVMALTACGTADSGGPRPVTPMPSQVPTTPQYRTADHVVSAMAAGGIECTLLRRAEAHFGSGLDCVATVDGAKVENQIHVLDPARFSRDDVGDSIAGRRKAPYHQTVVAAGNWYVRVLNPDYAPRIAHALKGVVLEPLGGRDR